MKNVKEGHPVGRNSGLNTSDGEKSVKVDWEVKRSRQFGDVIGGQGDRIWWWIECMGWGTGKTSEYYFGIIVRTERGEAHRHLMRCLAQRTLRPQQLCWCCGVWDCGWRQQTELLWRKIWHWSHSDCRTSSSQSNLKVMFQTGNKTFHFVVFEIFLSFSTFFSLPICLLYHSFSLWHIYLFVTFGHLC